MARRGRPGRRFIRPSTTCPPPARRRCSTNIPRRSSRMISFPRAIAKKAANKRAAKPLPRSLPPRSPPPRSLSRLRHLRRRRTLARPATRDKSAQRAARKSVNKSKAVEKAMEDFHRIRRLPPYVFEQVNRAKATARNTGADIIDLGMGDPDLPAPAHVIEKLKEPICKPRTDRYSSSKGIPGLRRAQAAYYARRFGVKLNPDTQIVTTLGSKEVFANVAQAITAPGDVVLVPNPSYPIHAFGFLMAGGGGLAVLPGLAPGPLRSHSRVS